MEIKLETEGESGDAISLVLLDDGLDNDNFVELILDGKCYTLSIDELMSATKTFINKRRARLEMEVLLRRSEREQLRAMIT